MLTLVCVAVADLEEENKPMKVTLGESNAGNTFTPKYKQKITAKIRGYYEKTKCRGGWA